MPRYTLDMTPTHLEPFAALPSNLALATLPKADVHVHAEAGARLGRVLARRAGRVHHGRAAEGAADRDRGLVRAGARDVSGG